MNDYENEKRRSEMRSAILTKELLSLRDQIMALDLDQRDILLDLVDPQPEPQVAQSTTKKKRKSSGKSTRASNMAATLGKNLAQQRAALDGGVSKMRCARTSDEGDDPTTCGEYADNPIHDKDAGYSGYHEFVPPSAQAAGVGD